MRTTRDPINLNRLSYFAAVVEAGSFTRAAVRLGVTKAVVSQHLAKLEQELGVTLLTRTTRKVSATEAGRALHARCLVILRESEEAFDELAEATAEPSGTLRITAPLDYGAAVVVRVATAFSQEHPRCRVELMLSDRVIDVQTVDLAIRVGWLPDSNHVVRRIAAMEQYLVCSAQLASSLPELEAPELLAGLPFVANLALPEATVGRFSHRELGRRSVRVQARLALDATPAVHAAVLAGAGISVLPDYLVEADLAAGRLVRLLPAWSLRRGGIHALLPSARFRPAKVTRFLEALQREEAQRAVLRSA